MTLLEVLAVHERPRSFDALAERLPEVRLRAVADWEEAEPHLVTAEVLVTIGDGFSREVAARMPALQWLQCMIAGVDDPLVALAERPDVVLTSARGIHGPQMTEAALYHLLCLSRDVRRTVRAQEDRRWERWDPRLLAGRTVGIVGIGVVGEHVARACAALGMTVLGVSQTPRSVPGIERMYARSDLPTVAAEVDFLLLTVALTRDTERLVDARVLAAMKPSAFLVNLSRGGVVDTDALVAALESRSIAGAGLDAFDVEPLPAEHALWGLDNVFITAHMGGRSDRYVDDVITIFEPNLRCWLAGDYRSMLNVVER